MSLSPFYDDLSDAQKFSLTFPLDNEGSGPYWLDSGELVSANATESDVEDIEAVVLGNDRYRLAEQCMGPFSNLRLHWGDEFIAKLLEGNKLLLVKLVVPRQFEHFRFLTARGFNNSNPVAELVHELGGGWETVAIGMLTITVPASKAQEFLAKVRAANLYLGFGLED